MMRLLIKSLLLFVVATAAPAQTIWVDPPPPPKNYLSINKLIVESGSLPDADRTRIITSFLHQAIPPDQDEFSERIRQALRELGYFKARINASDVSFAPLPEIKAVNLTVKVEPGPQYRLGQIRFQKAIVSSPGQLRPLFPLKDGDLFNTTKFSTGLDALRRFYATGGYVNVVASPVPRIDESRHIIDIVLSLDEGNPYNFGHLNLQGVEPYAGASKALLASWKPLEGERFNSLVLQRWYEANCSIVLGGQNPWPAMVLNQQVDPYIVNVTLKQPCR
jgi:hypothetical protein